MPFTLRGLRRFRLVAGHAAALAAAVALCAFTGPFGTYDSMGPLSRLGYWALAMSGNWGLCAGAVMLAMHLTQEAPRGRRALTVMAAALLAAIPGAAVVLAAETLFRPGDVDFGLVPTVYVSVAVLSLAISGAVLALRGRAARQQPDAPAAVRAAPPFLKRLPPAIGRDLICLKMADHYVEAVTAGGSGLVLMRFADAIAELEGVDGMRVHRSYWVARRHVTGAERRNGRQTLCLTGGHRVPVSRTYLPKVRAAGLIRAAPPAAPAEAGGAKALKANGQGKAET